MAKIPETHAAENVAGDGWIELRAMQEKQAWQAERAYQGNPIATIYRVTEAGGVPYAGVQPTYTQVPGLTDIPVCKFDNQFSIERRWGSLYKSGDREFIFYPTVVGQDAAVRVNDIIQHAGDEYRAVSIDTDTNTGRCRVLSRLNRPGS